MSSKRPRKRLDQKVKYVGLPHWLLNCAAWQTLPPLAKVIYVECFELNYNGANNGDIKRSERQVAQRHRCTQRTAAKMLGLLQEHGFIKPNVKGRFHVKVRYATTWVLTRYELNGAKPTADFAKFKQRMLPEQQTDAPRAADGPKTSLSDAPRAADSAHFGRPTDAPRAAQLVYQGEVPKGTRQAKAAWLRGHIESGALTPDAVARVLAIRPTEVEAIAVGKTELGQFGWRKIAALVESRLH